MPVTPLSFVVVGVLLYGIGAFLTRNITTQLIGVSGVVGFTFIYLFRREEYWYSSAGSLPHIPNFIEIQVIVLASLVVYIALVSKCLISFKNIIITMMNHTFAICRLEFEE